ncbi:hypothetical protein BD309DRAFT_949569 [Dichomitus squalens]|uniref:Uncharacterized protein n=1 Tax=Dichomitus squalens TaxID=114155 RepID=A0A4Q9P348_9APHY|nr:hypothetical protein BD309DRAFT_949569 [Dichomitus squalens]TBU58752.1 hypothetical protein BD310DRAFT_926467 [Dichomitus squalens]
MALTVRGKAGYGCDLGCALLSSTILAKKGSQASMLYTVPYILTAIGKDDHASRGKGRRLTWAESGGFRSLL